MEGIPSPKDLGIPHNEWRPNQYKMYEKCKNLHDSGGGFIFGELGTGSGKSAVAAALANEDRVTVLTHTLGLLDQYAEKYGFQTIKGRQEYPCADDKKNREWQARYGYLPTALDCHHDNMMHCPFVGSCAYIIQKHIALSSKKMVCTYRYASVSQKVQARSGILVLDEAHDSAEEIISDNEFAIRKAILSAYNLPRFPLIAFGPNGKGDTLNEAQVGLVKTWLKECIELMSYSEDEMKSENGAKAMRVRNRFSKLLSSLDNGDPYFALKDDNTEEPVLKALSAKETTERIFQSKTTTLLMSATIGDPLPLATELGIDNYEFESFPHPIPFEYRYVDMVKAPKMTYHNLSKDPNLYAYQGAVVARWIKQFDPRWRGVVLTTSYYKLQRLADYLRYHFPERRIISQGSDTHLSTMIKDFVTDVREGDIAVATMQGWGSGIDLYGDLARFIVIAGVPHQNPRDLYAKARRGLFGGERYQMWCTYNAVMQACGRVSRGETNTDGSWMSNYAALADASAYTAKALKFYSPWFKEAMRRT